MRQTSSLPLLAAVKTWFELQQLRQIPPRGGPGDAIRYALTRWDDLCRFIEDGASNSTPTPSSAPSARLPSGARNHLFAGSDGGAERWATVCSLITIAKLNDAEPFALS